jgi:hydroxyacylglutathione hydrolase
MNQPIFHISFVPILKDNYIWVIINASTQKVIAIDPGEAQPLEQFLQSNQLQLDCIWITHHHADHTQGLDALVKKHPVPVYGSKRCPITLITHRVAEPDMLSFEMLNYPVQILDIPGHTIDHIAYYFPGVLFCGDTLFSAGCGRVFEGTMVQMYQSLQNIAALPDDTLIYCTHEYTLNNLKFATLVEPNNPNIPRKMIEATQQRKANLPTLPTRLSDEKLFNPFLRCHSEEIIKNVAQHGGVEYETPSAVFKQLREWKNLY